MKHRACLRILRLLTVLAIVGWIAIGPALHSQTLSVTGTILSLDQISVRDLDFQNFHSNRPFFALVMTASPPDRVILTIRITADLSDGTKLDPLALAISEPFFLSGTKRITNVDLGPQGSIPLNENESGIVDAAGKKINDVLQTTGKLPSGTYTFEVSLASTKPNINPAELHPPLTVTIENPSRVELLSPSDDTEWPNPFPVFQWSSNTDEVILGVYEKLPGTNTPQEAISGVPQLRIRLPKVNTLQYPASGSGVRPLDPGKSYYWLVQGIVRSGTNTEGYLSSEIWQVNIARQSGSAAAAAILSQLEDIAGSQFQAVIARLLEMGFEPTGLLHFGGVTMTWAEFLQNVRSGKFQISNMTID